MAKTGLSYYQAETDRFQDIRVKRLKKRYGCEGYAIYQYILNEIYRVEGCYIRFTDDQMFDVSEYWCIDEERIEAIIEYCTEVEIFDTITWHTKKVLTSADIQQRYLEICRRAKKKIVLPEDIRLVVIQDAPSGTDNAPLPLFSGQEIETKTGKTTYGSPKLDAGKGTADGIGKTAKADTGMLSERIIPQSSAGIPETPRNSAEKRHKEKESKENPPSIPRTIPQTRDDEDKVSLLPGGNAGNASAEFCGKPSSEKYPLKLEHLACVCRSMSCDQQNLRQILLIEDIALDSSPIWELMEEVRNSGGRYSFSYVIQSLRALIISGRLRMMQAKQEPVLSRAEARRLVVGIGVPCYEIDEICEKSVGKEQVLKEAINAVRCSKGKILMPGCFIRSKLEKTKITKKIA